MNLFIFDRSDLDEVLCYDPKTKTSYTRREELERRDYHRADVVLANGTRSGAQYLLCVTATGFAGDLWLLDILNDEEFERLNAIAGRMRHNAMNFPPASKYLQAS
jgi:hypothetical protein